MSYWNWKVHNKKRGEEDTVVCRICLEERQVHFINGVADEAHVTEINAAMQLHMDRDHEIVQGADERTVFEVRQQDIVGAQVDHASRDCDGPHQSGGIFALPEGMTWAFWVGREMTDGHTSEGMEITEEGLRLTSGGPTDEGYTSTSYKAVFRHEQKLDDPELDYHRDVFAESMNY